MDALTHIPVLTKELLFYLKPQPGKLYVDVTFGLGGHTKAILEHQAQCRVIAIDWDRDTLDKYGMQLKEQFGNRLTLIWGNFAQIARLLKKEGIQQVDGIIADFGPSTIQLKTKAGFAFADTPLDMRMSPGHQKLTAADVVNTATEKELRDIFAYFGEERYANRIARAIIEQRKKKPITTTGQLAQIVLSVVPKNYRTKIHPATRIFQALRIYVNKELDNISSLLQAAIPLLVPKGKLICISFHSLEDRLVKQFFVQKEQERLLQILTPKVIMADPQEIKNNPSARSARLRAAQLI